MQIFCHFTVKYFDHIIIILISNEDLHKSHKHRFCNFRTAAYGKKVNYKKIIFILVDETLVTFERLRSTLFIGSNLASVNYEDQFFSES